MTTPCRPRRVRVTVLGDLLRDATGQPVDADGDGEAGGTFHRLGRHSFSLCPPPTDIVRVGSRRWFLQTGIAGLAGASLPLVLGRPGP